MIINSRNDTRTLPDGAILVKLTQGQVAMVDEVDWERIKRRKWYATLTRSRASFCASAACTVAGRRGAVLMHRDIMRPKPELLVDHINHNPLDNRRCNLRICTKSENQRNRKGLNKNNTTGYIGVHRLRGGRYAAEAGADGTHYLGTFDTKEEAALARDEFVRKAHGEFATLNFPEV